MKYRIIKKTFAAGNVKFMPEYLPEEKKCHWWQTPKPAEWSPLSWVEYDTQEEAQEQIDSVKKLVQVKLETVHQETF